MAENAIYMANKIEKNDEILTLCRYRISYPNYSRDYYNPLNYIFDLRIRDIAEYIKSKFFSNEDVYDDINYILNNYKLSDYEYKMFYVRLLYPSYYFDLFEDCILDNKEEKELINIIKLTDKYEIFLKDVYYLISKFTYIDKIDWIIKKE